MYRDDRARLESVFGTAVGALGAAGVGNVEKDARMHAPERRVRTRAVQGEVFGADFYECLGDVGRGGDGGHGDF